MNVRRKVGTKMTLKWKSEKMKSALQFLLEFLIRHMDEAYGLFKNAWPLVIQTRLWNQWKKWNQTERIKKTNFHIYSMSSYIFNNCTYGHDCWNKRQREREMIWIKEIQKNCYGIQKWSQNLQFNSSDDDIMNCHDIFVVYFYSYWSVTPSLSFHFHNTHNKRLLYSA